MSLFESNWDKFVPIALQIRLPCPSTWFVLSPRRPAWYCVSASRSELQPTHGTRCLFNHSYQCSGCIMCIYLSWSIDLYGVLSNCELMLFVTLCFLPQIVDELREQILKLRFPHRVQNKETTPKAKRKAVAHPSPSKSPSIPVTKSALSDRPCVVVLNKPLEKLLIRSESWETITDI